MKIVGKLWSPFEKAVLNVSRPSPHRNMHEKGACLFIDGETEARSQVVTQQVCGQMGP